MSPPTLAAILLLVANDHLLKGSGVVPSIVTGKLSDVAFLFFAPILLAYLIQARTRVAAFGAFAAPAALFVAINLSPTASETFERALSLVVPSKHLCDAEDLVALAVLPLSWRHLWRHGARAVRRSASPRTWRHVAVVIVASLGCVATSSQPPEPMPMMPTHRAVYLSWEEFRSTAVQVKAPQPVGKRGKLLITDGHLFLSEPGLGVHVFDNTEPKSPRPLMFIQIPGNVDIAIRNGQLYADSFVDLLVFDLDLTNGSAKLAERLEDQFDYDPYQTLTSDTPVHVEGLDRKRGVVVRLEPIHSPPEVAQ